MIEKLGTMWNDNDIPVVKIDGVPYTLEGETENGYTSCHLITEIISEVFYRVVADIDETQTFTIRLIGNGAEIIKN